MAFRLVPFVTDFSTETKKWLSLEAGDSACEEAHYLSKLCSKVTMLVRSDKFRASKIMEARVRKTENISILMNHDTVEILGDGQVVTGVKARNKTTGDIFDIPATGFFFGHWPQTKHRYF